ncbi:MAG TPA: hypothetical protein VM238_20905 [Phycisphaerae bacterium]|nr:hypothetical protein [Phycisphaerae bacterium]
MFRRPIDRRPRLGASVFGPCVLVALMACGIAAADPGSILGGGNFGVSRDLAKAESQFKALNVVGAGMCRIPVSEGVYFSPQEKKPLPQRCDSLVLMAQKHGITPILLFEYYTRWNGPLGGHAKWHAVGRAFAERFRPNSPWLGSQGVRDWGIRVYTAINEPTWKSNNPTPIPPADYAAAIEGLADGVHSVEAALHVSPGGYIEGSLHAGKNPYVKAVAPLYNGGKLWSLDIHRYWDVKHVPMEGTWEHSLQNQFDQVKRDVGITADIRFHTTEMNFKKRLLSEDDAAKGFFTALWDALGVVGNRGQRVTEFVLPWNIFNLAAKDDHYGLCTQLAPWTPTARGKVLRMVCRLTRGTEFVACRPKGKGEFVLEGGGRKVWVWQNRKAWTDRPGPAYRVTGIPAAATTLDVYRYNSWDGPWRTFEVGGKDAFTVSGLEPGETYLLLARR